VPYCGKFYMKILGGGHYHVQLLFEQLTIQWYSVAALDIDAV